MYEIANEFKIAKKAYQRLEKLKRQGSILIGESVPKLTPPVGGTPSHREYREVKEFLIHTRPTIHEVLYSGAKLAGIFFLLLQCFTKKRFLPRS